MAGELNAGSSCTARHGRRGSIRRWNDPGDPRTLEGPLNGLRRATQGLLSRSGRCDELELDGACCPCADQRVRTSGVVESLQERLQQWVVLG